ncbi:MAG TPA: hypothetical protein VK932_19465 [Kofleriaceae bacterium]|nr:hypothetical protein [Kofleriaceae bacterium]
MAFLDDLAAGRIGLQVRPPGSLTVTEQGERAAVLHDPEHDLDWWFFFFPELYLDLAPDHAASHDRDIHRHARQVFDAMFELQRGQAGRAEMGPRTADPKWTPVVEIERFELDGAPALSVLHRMQYQPGAESILGHTLIPVEGGLFEARWLAAATMTGIRESVLGIKLLSKRSDVEEIDPSIMPSQEEIDDPALDAEFPNHPLSLARAAKRWHERAQVRVDRRAAAPLRDPVILRPIECSLSAPPRFTPGDTATDGGDVFCRLDRVSFCGTDGVDQIFVGRTGARVRGLAVGRRLAKLARDRSRTIFEQMGHDDVRCEVRPLDAVPPSVEVITEGEPQNPGAGRGRMLWRWFLDDSGRAWTIAFRTTVALPLDEIAEEVAAVARSWKRLDRG